MTHQNQATRLSITRSLHVHGWGHLDPVLLASLATEAPLLLVGAHGTAKSLLIERIAGALGLSMRHYNASLLNYDDLVGIPIPEEDNDSLRFITTPGSIWDAEFVFFDEISRCRPDLQNKMFPIIHERRVAGIQLHKLRHRWAAMNPPAPEEPGAANPGQPVSYYLGSEPLDPALADRFPFVVAVPDWRQLSKDDRRRVVSWSDDHADVAMFDPDGLEQMVAECAARIPELEAQLDSWLSDYMVLVMDLLDKAQLPQSPRRARMLARSVVAVHAARLVLEGEEAELDDSAEIALTFGLPQNATDVPPSPATVAAVHRQAWEVASLLEDDQWRQILEEREFPRRVVMADQMGFSDPDLSRLITQTLSAEASEARRVSLGVAMFLAYRARRELTPAAWEPLAQLAARVLEPRGMTGLVRPGADASLWQEVREWLGSADRDTSPLGQLARNYILAGFPDLWRRENWKEALERFQGDLNLFGVPEVL
ncbi:MAG: AAA family ATPase [Chloroflexi bacterium]|nr:AAA family ATPase [Chloroflexota bacterium]